LRLRRVEVEWWSYVFTREDGNTVVTETWMDDARTYPQP
jgi:hypothetical protein